MHLLSLVCTCNLLFAKCISDFPNLQFCSGNMECMHLVASNLSLVFGSYRSFLQGISYLQTPLLMVEFFWCLLCSSFLLLSVSPILPLLDSIMFGKRFLTKKVLNEMEFYILSLCSKFWDSVLFLSRLLQNVSIFLLMKRMEYLLTRIILLSMSEPFLILTELIFSGFKCMLKHVYCRAVIPTICLLLTPCLSVVVMMLLLLLVTIMEFFQSSFCEKNSCLSYFLHVCVWGAKKRKGIFVFYKNIFGLYFGSIWFLNFFPNRYSPCFCRSNAFSFNIDLTWYWEFITLPNIFNLL